MVALLVSVLHDPMGKGIAGYDFSTPEAAAKSIMQIKANGDVRALLEIDQTGMGGDSVRTFDVNRVADFADKKALFVSYLQKGEKQKKVIWFEKDLESKRWLPKFVSSYDVEKTNEQLSKEIRAWEKSAVD